MFLSDSSKAGLRLFFSSTSFRVVVSKLKRRDEMKSIFSHRKAQTKSRGATLCDGDLFAQSRDELAHKLCMTSSERSRRAWWGSYWASWSSFPSLNVPFCYVFISEINAQYRSNSFLRILKAFSREILMSAKNYMPNLDGIIRLNFTFLALCFD